VNFFFPLKWPGFLYTCVWGEMLQSVGVCCGGGDTMAFGTYMAIKLYGITSQKTVVFVTETSLIKHQKQ